jgi:hypothetical protein
MKTGIVILSISAVASLLLSYSAHASLTPISEANVSRSDDMPLVTRNHGGTMGVQSSGVTFVNDEVSFQAASPRRGSRRPSMESVSSVSTPVSMHESEHGSSGGGYEVSETPTRTVVPEPTTMIAGALMLLPFGVALLRQRRGHLTS